jgi:hypothetical protein
MKKIVSSVALLAFTGNILMAGGSVAPLEPEMSIPEQDIVILEDNVKYDGFYAGGAISHMNMSESVSAESYAFTLLAGYYFNKYFGLEARYTQTIGGMDITPSTAPVSVDKMKNYGLYAKPMLSITTGLALYALAGYGRSSYTTNGITYSDTGLQWGLGAKYELSGGLGLFIDYINMYDGNNYGNLPYAGDIQFDGMNVGATYTF